MKVSAIIPAYNEEKSISATINSLKRIAQIKQIVVVDDGSKDNTCSVAHKAGAQVIRLAKNRGKAYALLKGYEWATGDVLLFVDGDLGSCAVELRRLLQPIEKGEADFAIAKFPEPKKKKGFGLVKFIAGWGVEKITGQKVSCVLSGQRAILKEKFDKAYLSYKGFGVETGMTIDLILAGCRYQEIPLVLFHKETGMDLKGILHRGKQFWEILVVICRKGVFR